MLSIILVLGDADELLLYAEELLPEAVLVELPIAERPDVALELLPTLATDDLLAMFAELLL